MVFSTPIFLFYFLALTLLVYYLVPRKLRNPVVLIASLFFYYWGEQTYVAIMFLSTAIDYTHGLLVERCKAKGNDKGARMAVASSVIFNLALLLFFKYWDFLAASFQAMGLNFMPVLGIHLPIGISFYTFQTMSYTIDVYRGDAPIQKNPLNVALYVALFPQLVAGPIVRYTTVMEDISTRQESLDEFAAGVTRFCFGLAKKMVLANAMGQIADGVFNQTAANLDPGLAWVGALAYTFQIYFDFSAYSDMAIGLGHMFGFRFLENFDYPYISISVTEFWRRWHISLSTWFRDYVFYPLSLSKFFTKVGKKGRQVLGNYIGKMLPVLIPQFIIFFLIGIWHGAEWKYIAFGFYNGTLIVLGILFEEPLRNLDEKLHINTQCFSWHLFQILRTLVLVALGKIITRAAGFSISVSMMHSMIVNWDTDILFNGGLLQLGLDSKDLWVLVLASLVLLAVSIMQECGIKVRETLAKQNLYFRWAVYLCAVFSLIIFGVYGLNYNAADFIYRGF